MSYFLFSINNNNQMTVNAYSQYSLSGLFFNSYNPNFNYINPNSGNALTYFQSATPLVTNGVVTSINFYTSSPNGWNNLDSPTNPVFVYTVAAPQNIAVSFFGYFLATKSGVWTFTLGVNGNSNDDLSAFWIGTAGQTIADLKTTATIANVSKAVNNVTGIANSTFTISLVIGNFYPILLNYGQGTSTATLGLGITPPNGTITYDGTPYYFH